MIKEYCDRCKSEIKREEKGKVLNISYKTGRYAYGYECEESARITLCPKCFSEMGISDTVSKCRSGAREENDVPTVERLMDIFRELVAECMEEQ